jgi:sec-independent protein translocase protein TatC
MTTMSTKRHLRELQWRLMLVAAFFIIGATLAYTYQSTLIPLLLNPLHGEKLIYLNPAGGFSFIFLISIYAGIALSFPIFLQQIYSFLRPALPKSAQRKSSIIIVSSLLLLVAGIAFGYLVAVPNALTFLYSFADQYVNASLTADSYLNFIIAYTIGIGIVFQLPLLLLLIHTIKPFTPGGLMRSEKWVILVAFIIAAIITPTPDPINQTIIAGPVVIVYQIGVVAVLLNIAKKRRILKREQRQAATAAALPETALSLEAPPIAGPVVAQTPTHITQQPQPLRTRPAPTTHKTMDGVIARRPAPQLQVP